jgi:hypothetical protein
MLHTMLHALLYIAPSCFFFSNKKVICTLYSPRTYLKNRELILGFGGDIDDYLKNNERYSQSQPRKPFP